MENNEIMNNEVFETVTDVVNDGGKNTLKVLGETALGVGVVIGAWEGGKWVYRKLKVKLSEVNAKRKAKKEKKDEPVDTVFADIDE